MKLYDEIHFETVERKYLLYSSPAPFESETNSIEFIRNGRLVLECENDRIPLVAPVVFWMRQGKHYRFVLPDNPQSPLEHLYVDYYGNRSNQITEQLEELCPEGFLIPANPDQITGLFLKMLKFYRINAELHHPELAVGIEEITLNLLQSLRSSAQAFPEKSHGIWQLAEDIRVNPFRDFDFRKIAASARISYDRFRKIFKERVGMPPQTYVRNQRLFLAASLLRSTNMRVKEVMYTCHFESLMDFSRSFRKYSGMSPSDYRNSFHDLRMHKSNLGKP